MVAFWARLGTRGLRGGGGCAVQFDADMASKAAAAAAQGAKLCYVGSVDLTAGTCSVSLQVPHFQPPPAE